MAWAMQSMPARITAENSTPEDWTDWQAMSKAAMEAHRWEAHNWSWKVQP